MIEAVLVTILPVGFLIILFWGGALFLQKKISQDGEAPINRPLFYASKWSIMILWGAMALASWGIGFTPYQVPRILAAHCARVLVCRIRSSVSRAIQNGGFLSSRNPKRGHQPQNGRIIPGEQEPDVRGRVCNYRGSFPLHVKPGRYPAGGVCHCRPPCNRSCGRENYGKGIQPAIFGVLQTRTAVRLTERQRGRIREKRGGVTKVNRSLFFRVFDRPCLFCDVRFNCCFEEIEHTIPHNFRIDSKSSIVSFIYVYESETPWL